MSRNGYFERLLTLCLSHAVQDRTQHLYFRWETSGEVTPEICSSIAVVSIRNEHPIVSLKSGEGPSFHSQTVIKAGPNLNVSSLCYKDLKAHVYST